MPDLVEHRPVIGLLFVPDLVEHRPVIGLLCPIW